MKKKISISTAIPAHMSGFSKTENPHLTTATLKVFHSGLTQDGRYFTKKFADKIAATIGGTPVVAKYDMEELDFIGHAHEQSVFGFVPENPIIGSEEDENGNSWLVTDVKLFTERHDVGKIARKIVGHSQSLELDPDSIKVEFVEDEEGEFERIDFHDGDLIGLSVLGIQQEPAFEGSGFFTKTLQVDKVEELIAKYNAIPTSIVMETGGESMTKEIIFEGKGFKIFRTEGKIIVEDTDGTENDITAALSVEPEEAEETVEEEEVKEETPEAEEELNVEDVVKEPEVKEEVPTVDNTIIEELEDPVIKGDEAEDAEGQGEEPEPVKEESGLEPEAAKAAADATALNQAEREELENYRRNDKLATIDSYSEYISEEDLEEFKINVDAFAKEELDKELSFSAMQTLRGKKETKPTFAFNLKAKEGKGSDPVADAIRNLQ